MILRADLALLSASDVVYWTKSGLCPLAKVKQTTAGYPSIAAFHPEQSCTRMASRRAHLVQDTAEVFRPLPPGSGITPRERKVGLGVGHRLLCFCDLDSGRG